MLGADSTSSGRATWRSSTRPPPTRAGRAARRTTTPSAARRTSSTTTRTRVPRRRRRAAGGLGGARIPGVAHHMVLRGDAVAALGPPWRRATARRSTPRSSCRRVSRQRAAAFSEYQLYFHWRGGASSACACASPIGQRARADGYRRVRAGERPPPRCGRWVTPEAVRRSGRGPTRRHRYASGGRASRPAAGPPTAACLGAAARGPASRAASTSGSSAGTAPRRLRGSAPLGNFLRLLPSPWPLLGPLPRSLGRPRESRPLGPWPLGPRRAYPYRTRTGGTGFRRERDGEIGSCAR